MADLDPARHRHQAVPQAPSGQHGSAARSQLPHGVDHHPDIRELLRNSVLHFGGNDATVAHLLEMNSKNLMSGDPRMKSKHGIALYEPLNHFRQRDAHRLADALLGARRHASPESRDLYTAAIHHLGYRFDGHGHLHKAHRADFAAAMKNPAFLAHLAVEHDHAAYQQQVRDRPGGPAGASGREADRANGSGLEAGRRGSSGPVNNRRGAVPNL